MKRLSESLCVVVLSSVMLAACGGGSSNDGGAGKGGSGGATGGNGGSTGGTGGSTAGTTGSTGGSGGATGGTTGSIGGSGGATGGNGGATGGADGGLAGSDGGVAGTDGGAAGHDGGAAGTDGGAAGTDGGVADGGTSLTAKATITATTGNTIAGTATFTNAAGIVTMVLAVTNCPVGAHPFHLHINNVCGADGQAAGGHWTPKGDTGLGNLTCLADGTGTAMFVTPTVGYWTIGGDAATDLTLHAVMVHGATDTTMRIGCGVPVKQ